MTVIGVVDVIGLLTTAGLCDVGHAMDRWIAGRPLGPRYYHLAKRITAIREKSSSRLRGGGDPTLGQLASLGVTAVECADAHGEYKIEWLLVTPQHEILDSDLAYAHAAGSDLLGRGSSRLLDSNGGSVDGKNVSGFELGGDSSGRCSWTAPDFQDSQMGLESKRVHNGRQTR